MSIWSAMEGIKNRSRFIMSERIKFYLIAFAAAVAFTFIAFYSTAEQAYGLAVSSIVFLTLIIGNLVYYTKVERVTNRLEMIFRMLKYLLFSILFLFFSLIISEIY